MTATGPDEMLAEHLKRVPPFRALMRTQEHRLFATEPLRSPVLDIGIGDGHFADAVFPCGIEAGVDITWALVAEARSHGPYHSVAAADGTRLPYRASSFHTVVSNCVMEHIPDLEGLVCEVGRVLTPGGRFVFSAINDNFTGYLGTVRRLRHLGMKGLADRYAGWWNRKAVHFHFDSPDAWQERLARWGLVLDRHNYYMSPQSMQVFEFLHYYAVPSLAWHRLSGRWSLRDEAAGSGWLHDWLERYAAEPEPMLGACSFYVAHKV